MFFLKIYFDVWESFKENNFGDGKVIWCIYGGSVSPEKISSGRQISVDITGTENQRIFSVLGTNQDCPDAAMTQTGQYRVLPIFANDG